ncbi:hypothetical protein C8J27_10493 [Rhodobacter aestuarii]|uniref:Uncharacterized protein n=1 Tax=Rhodobacter aestuarii TaxID=453582 RepID=A0A1N7L0R6_9RHOB|nr:MULTISPECIES: hypothetical protein [Rhodobacter]PTV95457.1 hypothetical protein C8J27_10493 [Rhodobacter aestuarii]SIS67425.1 hypothetical protein SAMN05421580_103161 [Rhodobacter aestuarii]SOB90061.1 hypothetical protein SAMN05877809_101119 [Rhodobacter sp. JA431]
MSDFVSDTIEGLIVGMAESLRAAQEQLNATPPLDGWGRPTQQYRIPHLDFEINFTLTHDEASGRQKIKRIGKTDGTTHSEGNAKISGRFVAVPAGDGMPLPVLALRRVPEKKQKPRLVVVAGNTAGELLIGARVELNIDQAASAALSEAAGVRGIRFSDHVQFETAVLDTGNDGTADTVVTLSNRLPDKALVVITAALGPETASLVLGKEG